MRETNINNSRAKSTISKGNTQNSFQLQRARKQTGSLLTVKHSQQKFRVKTLPNNSNISTSSPKINQKRQFHRYDSSVYHKTIFHLMPLKDNPEMFTKVTNQGGIITRNGIVPLSALKKGTKIANDGSKIRTNNKQKQPLLEHKKIIQSTNNLSKKYFDKIIEAEGMHNPYRQVTLQIPKINSFGNISEASNQSIEASNQQKQKRRQTSPRKVYMPHTVQVRNFFLKFSGLESALPKIIEDQTKVLVTAKKWLIYDMNLNQGIKGYKHKKSHDVASLSKLITFYACYTIIQQYFLSLDKFQLIVDQEDQVIQGTRVKLKRQNVVSLEDMLYALLLSSANNAATVLAKNLGSLITKKNKNQYFSCYDVLTQDKHKNSTVFMRVVWQVIKKLNLSQETKMSNPHGMCNNFSSALDIAKVISECFKIPLFCKIINTKQKTIKTKFIDQTGDISTAKIYLQNTNKLLWSDSGCIGGKTGCNSKGGQSFVGCFDGRIAVVVLGSIGKEQKFMDCQKLVGWLKQKLQISKHECSKLEQ